MVWHDAREIVREHPEYALTPQPLTDTKIADLGAGATIERFGYRIQVSWTKVVAEKPTKSVTILTFTDSGNMLIWDSPAAMGLASVARGQTAEDRANAATLYGAREVRFQLRVHGGGNARDRLGNRSVSAKNKERAAARKSA